MFKGFDIKENINVAVKVNKRSLFNDVDRYYERQEGNILSSLDHKNIIQLYHMIDTDDIYLVFPLMNESLFDYIYSANYKYVKEDTKSLMTQTLNGLKYLHTLNYVHRDMKPDNILLDHKKTLKISDFGLATTINSYEKLYTKCGTTSYQAPEMLLKTGYDEKIDVWVSIFFFNKVKLLSNK